ncbi:MAG: TonB-dependent receptor [Myxococcaceae bacterium]|nr:TonB-dependent receptor [Myxococcaceae bacterium]
MTTSRWARLALAAVLVWSQATLADPRVEARRHFKTGMFLIGEGKYDEAIAELLEAYAIKPHPNVLFNVARAHEAAGRPVEALAFYRRYLDANPPDAASVRETVAKLEPLVPVKTEPLPAVEPVKPVDPKSRPVAPALDEATLAKVTALTERLERVVEKAERRASEEEALPAERPASGDATPAPVEDFSVPYEETVVAAARRSQSSLEAPNATTVITGDEIRASGLTTIPELLRRVPGAEVMTMGWSSANLSIRGFNQRINNKVLVLIDGRPEYQDFLGVTLWPVLPIGVEEIERIEVIRGPAGALYGANAMLGVVNIITRAPGTGPKAEATGFVGNGNLAGGSFVASGGDALKYRASVGYQQADKFSRDFAEGRPDVVSAVPEPNLGLRSARANLTAFYAFNKHVSLSASGGVNRLFTEVYGIGLLRNYFLDGTGGYAKVDFTGGPVKVRFFWNHLNAVAGPQYAVRGQRDLETTLDSNVFDAEALFQQGFELGGRHQLSIGASGRLKRLAWSYIGPLTQELHGAAFVQDEWKLLSSLSIVGSFRLDRHPLINLGQPGVVPSPRLSVVFTPFEGNAFRGMVASAFRQPTFLESYVNLPVPAPGAPGASVLTQGNRTLVPESLLSFELGYRGEAARLGLSWDVAGYVNFVRNLIVLSAVNPLPAAGAFDGRSQSFLVGRSTFENDPGNYRAVGGEVGLTWNATRGLDLRLSTALQTIQSVENRPVCGPCSQAPAVKLNGGFVYRTPVNLDLSADVSYVSGTTWVEREPAASDPTSILNLQNPLPGFTVINARVAYRLFNDRFTVAVVGQQLGPTHQEHPFGNAINRRVFAQLSVQP